MQLDLNLLMPTAMAFAALASLAFAIAAQSGAPNSGMLLLPEVKALGTSLG